MNNTINYYNKNAKEYFQNTINGNMKLSYDTFLKHIPKGGYILDFGCGSGRDSKYFLDYGYKIKAIDGSKELCLLAENYINQKVENMCFRELNDINIYDGIWCCASLLHIEKTELLEVLNKIIIALKDNGIMYISIKEGTGEEITNERYFKYYTKEEFINILVNVEKYSNHPIAKAITLLDSSKTLDVYDIKEIAGLGIECKIDNKKVLDIN